MKNLNVILLFFIIFSISYSSGTINEELIIETIKQYKIPLKNIENNDSDKNKLINSFKAKSIIGLGEATHGTDEFFKIRCQLSKLLINDLDFGVVAIEAGFQECNNLNEYVLNGTGNPLELINDLHHWFWKRQEMLDFIEWLREYNLDKKEGEKVIIAGFDMQWRNQSAKYISSYLKLHNPGVFASFKNQLDIISSTENVPLSTTEFEAIQKIEMELKDWGVLKTDSMNHKEFEITLQNIAVLKQSEPFLADRSGEKLIYEKIRDEFMAQNVVWLFNHMGKSGMIIWAHNGHISKGERCGFAKIICEEAMGNFLKKEYGDEYFPVGFVFNQGCFNAFSKEKVFKTFCVDEAPSGTLPYLLSRSQSDKCFIDFNQINDTRFVEEFLMKPLKNQSVGTYFVAKDRFGKIKLKDKYEALIFVDKSTKPVYLKEN